MCLCVCDVYYDESVCYINACVPVCVYVCVCLGVLSLQDFRRVSSGVFKRDSAAGSDWDRWTQRRHKSTHTRLNLGNGAHRTLQNIRTRYTQT